ncbi:Response regulator receiver domain-containing protein [Trichlorobacter thiogenes]|uniref:Response regulator receiver domain-containing protein n=1 Tax=Trichlorobacter thiogenes TaxID=115783 RepID=A0A1T4JUI2_9BACT|nr:response regulator [Trichlorobacter thiogenes]SJZ33775.1 Response regulator receiver domain-containing protein [Trichlorobacter thiogenes]
MDGYVKLHEMLETALRQAGEEAGMLLGQGLTATLTDSLTFSKAAYFGDLDDGVFVLAVESREEYVGQFHLVFNLRDAILMSSLLLGIPAPRIKEKQRLSIIEPDDIDAFGEIGNMINGAMNTTFQGSLSGKAHLKLLGSKKYVPEIDPLTDDDPLPNGDYLMFRSRLEMEGQEMHHLDVLIPVELGNQYDPPPEAPVAAVVEEAAATVASVANAEGVADEQAAASDEPPARKAGGVAGTVGEEMIAVFEDSDEERSQLLESLRFTNFKLVESTLNADVKEIFSQGNVRLVLIGSQDADDRELAVCIKINALRQDQPVPIIMCAQRWTRTAVLKALKYGAQDIIIKPCDPDELASKVKRLCRLPLS